MTEEQLLRTLRTVGLTCFVDNYELFNDLSLDKINIQQAVELVTSSSVSESSARTKSYAARRIFRAQLHFEALRLISNSNLVTNNLIEKSNRILTEAGEASTPIVTPIVERQNYDDISLIENVSIWNNKIPYGSLNAKQKENYNLLKLGAILAEHGFDLLRLNDDWQGADCIANHIDGTYLKIQLKGRLTIDKKYLDKDLYIAFRNATEWFLYPHDDFVDFLYKQNTAVESNSWTEHGHYSWPTLSTALISYLSKYKL